jgi:hypothetical protein
VGVQFQTAASAYNIQAGNIWMISADAFVRAQDFELDFSQQIVVLNLVQLKLIFCLKNATEKSYLKLKCSTTVAKKENLQFGH